MYLGYMYVLICWKDIYVTYIYWV